jgi:hypothetical protein
VSTTPDNFTQAVEKVKQWNKALESSEPNLRASTGSDSAGGPSRYTGGTPAKGPLSLAKPKPGAEAFLTPELAGKLYPGLLELWHCLLLCFCVVIALYERLALLTDLKIDDDNWDDDFTTAISPSALQLPHLKPQDNFGGLLSSDKLKSFASLNDSRNESNSYDDDFDGELMTIKGPSHFHDIDSQEQTIRPTPRRPEKPSVASPRAHHVRGKSSTSRAVGSQITSSHQHKSPPKSHFNKFELPSRPDLYYREQSVEDYSDLFVDNDNVFAQKPNQVDKKVSSPCACLGKRHAYNLL